MTEGVGGTHTVAAAGGTRSGFPAHGRPFGGRGMARGAACAARNSS